MTIVLLREVTNIRVGEFSPFKIIESFKKFGALSLALMISGSAALVFYLTGMKLLAIISFFFFLSVIFREPDIKTDTFMIESVSTFAMILSAISKPWIGALFCFATIWTTRAISPNGPTEEIVDTMAMSLGFSLVCFFTPLILARIPGFSLGYYLLFFHVLKFIMYYIFLSFLQPSVFFNDLMNAP
ncbi:MAG: hypothetical protein ABIF92_00260, partial [archaeon]